MADYDEYTIEYGEVWGISTALCRCGAKMDIFDNPKYPNEEEYACPVCGVHALSCGGFLMFPDDGFEYTEPYEIEEECEDYEGMSVDYEDIYGEDEGCAACGNPNYPDCMSSCPMGD